MRGDFTRNTYDPRKHYSSVRLQQGRVGPLDAEWNEQIDIAAQRERVTNQDTIGFSGGPKSKDPGNPALTGFRIDASGQDLTISKGRYYVQGILCENEKENLSIKLQDDLPAYDPLQLNAGSGIYLAYLDVWERHITALEDDEIREKALNCPDTTTRTKVIWQVKLAKPDRQVNSALSCSHVGPNWTPMGAASTGKLAARAMPGKESEGPCDMPEGAGYRRLDNQLYRVEIHQGGTLGTATFKWSRENGSVVSSWKGQNGSDLAVGSAGRDRALGFATDDWVELTDDTRELYARPGLLARVNKVDNKVVTLDPATIQDVEQIGVDFGKFPRNAKVRRWESKGAASVCVPAENEGWIELEDGVQIKFEAGDFRTGDYWMIPARTALHDVLWPKSRNGDDQPAFEACHGIVHRYAPLALVELSQSEGKWLWTVRSDCRELFPPLTAIDATDVSYDDANCDAVQATNVQAAIDQLCQTRDLRHHNKHLHGWGIVCGLQVTCGADDPSVSGDRRTVVVQPGYAIDCDGNDITLDEPCNLPIMDWIGDWDSANPNTPILRESGGECQGKCGLTIDRGRNGEPKFSVVPHDAKDDSLQNLFQGTLLMDFLQEDVLKPWEEIKAALFPTDNSDGRALVGTGQRQITAQLNLLVQLWNPVTGSYVYLSSQEHRLLEALYNKLRTLLESKTYCAMFDNAHQFPANYPFAYAQISTIFDLNTRSRLRINPAGNLGYATGADNKIHIYRLERRNLERRERRDQDQEELIGVLEMPGGTGLTVNDVAFSRDGRQLYSVGVVNDKDSVFAVADIDNNYSWGPVAVLCDVQLKTLATLPSARSPVYAVGFGKGLFKIEVTDVQPTISQEPNAWKCDALGQLLINSADETPSAFVTARASNGTGQLCDEVLEISLSQDSVKRTYLMATPRIQYDCQGDIVIVNWAARSGGRLYAVAKPTNGTGGTQGLLVFSLSHDPTIATITPDKFIPLVDGSLHLAYSGLVGETREGTYLMVISSEFNAMGLINLATEEAVPPAGPNMYFMPLQVAPIAIAASTETGRAYVVNSLSATITSIAGEYLKPDPAGSRQPSPGSSDFLEQMKNYRSEVLNAFLDLAGGVFQYLKDSFCYRFLTACPDKPSDNDKIYLGAVEIRKNEVCRICNFSKRKYVKTFPTLDYWLSVVPIAPFVAKLVEEFCCLLLPDLFAGRQAPQPPAVVAQVTNAQLIGAMFNFQQKRYQQPIAELWQRADVVRGAIGQELANIAGRASVNPSLVPFPPPEEKVRYADITNQRIDTVATRLKDSGVKDSDILVEKYDQTRSLDNLIGAGTAPLHISPGSRVTLIVQDDIVRYYRLERQQPEIQPIRDEVTALTKTIQELQASIKIRNEEMTRLRTQVEVLERAPATVTVATMQEELTSTRRELQELRASVTELQRSRP